MSEDWIKKNQERLTGEQNEILNNRESTIKYYTFAGFLVGIIPHLYFISKPIKIRPQFLGFKEIVGLLAFSQIPVFTAVLFSYNLRLEQKKFIHDLEVKMNDSENSLS